MSTPTCYGDWHVSTSCSLCEFQVNCKKYSLKRLGFQLRKQYMFGEHVSNLNPVDGVLCPRCGLPFLVRKLDCVDGWIESGFEYELVPNYCPMCGEKVVAQ